MVPDTSLGGQVGVEAGSREVEKSEKGESIVRGSPGAKVHRCKATGYAWDL